MAVPWRCISRYLEYTIPKQRGHASASSPCSMEWGSTRKQPNLRRLRLSHERWGTNGRLPRRKRSCSMNKRKRFVPLSPLSSFLAFQEIPLYHHLSLLSRCVEVHFTARPCLFTCVHSAQPPHFGPDECDQQHHQDCANATAGYRNDWTKELRHQAGLEAAQFVGR